MTQSSFDRLLLQLDADREAAGERYLKIREKLCKFFQWRNCPTFDDLADQTIDRVARRVDHGAEIRSGDMYLFFHGVAVNVLREYWKQAQKVQEKPFDEAPETKVAVENPIESAERSGDKERQMSCLDGCVGKLPAQQLMLITQYHQGQGGAKIAQRNALAEHFGIPLNALRIRAFRIRGELENCISECTKQGAA